MNSKTELREVARQIANSSTENQAVFFNEFLRQSKIIGLKRAIAVCGEVSSDLIARLDKDTLYKYKYQGIMDCISKIREEINLIKEKEVRINNH